MHHSEEQAKENGVPARITRRHLVKLGGLSGIFAAIYPSLTHAAMLPGTDQKSPEIGPIMQQLSTYMSAASERALPEDVVEKAKQHILDTFAAMISGSKLPPGRGALDFARSYGGPNIATVVASKIVCGPIEAAFGLCLVLGGQACVAVLTIATLATFLVYVPTALALNGSNAWSRMRLCRRSRREPMPRCWCYGLRQHGSVHMPRRICIRTPSKRRGTRYCCRLRCGRSRRSCASRH